MTDTVLIDRTTAEALLRACEANDYLVLTATLRAALSAIPDPDTITVNREALRHIYLEGWHANCKLCQAVGAALSESPAPKEQQ